jgi:hypothetical protein
MPAQRQAALTRITGPVRLRTRRLRTALFRLSSKFIRTLVTGPHRAPMRGWMTIRKPIHGMFQADIIVIYSILTVNCNCDVPSPWREYIKGRLSIKSEDITRPLRKQGLLSMRCSRIVHCVMLIGIREFSLFQQPSPNAPWVSLPQCASYHA